MNGLDVELIKTKLKEAYLKTLQDELQKLAESPETIVRINESASRLADGYASRMADDIRRLTADD